MSELVLKEGDIVEQWGVADRLSDNGIKYGVDGPIGWKLRVVLEDGQLRLRATDEVAL